MDIGEEIKETINKTTTINQWFSLAVKVGLSIVLLTYIKTIIRTIKEVLVQIWYAITGKDGLDIRELMGGTCWLLFLITGVKYLFFGFLLDVGWIGILLGYFCIMYGIEKVGDKIKKEDNESKQ